MTKRQLNRCIKFLKYFKVRIEEDAIYLHDGHTSVICNPDCDWKDFLGESICGIAYTVGEKINKKVIWED